MEKVKVQGFGNEGNFYYFIIQKKGFSSVWLTTFTDLVKNLSSSKGVRGVRLHDGAEDNFDITTLVDKHESYSADNARIDVFYGKDIINITVNSFSIQKDKFLDAMETLADFP